MKCNNCPYLDYDRCEDMYLCRFGFEYEDSKGNPSCKYNRRTLDKFKRERICELEWEEVYENGHSILIWKGGTMTRNKYSVIRWLPKKHKYKKYRLPVGSCLYSDDMDKVEIVDNSNEKQEVSQLDISKVVEARVVEILKVAKKEIKNLNNLVNLFLDIAENNAERNLSMSMNDWKIEVETSLKLFHYDVLEGKGKISAEKAKQKAESEYEKYTSMRFTLRTVRTAKGK